MTLRGIRSNCGNLRFQTLQARLQSSSGLFLDFSWVAADAEVTELLPAYQELSDFGKNELESKLSQLKRSR